MVAYKYVMYFREICLVLKWALPLVDLAKVLNRIRVSFALYLGLHQKYPSQLRNHPLLESFWKKKIQSDQVGDGIWLVVPVHPFRNHLRFPANASAILLDVTRREKWHHGRFLKPVPDAPYLVTTRCRVGDRTSLVFFVFFFFVLSFFLINVFRCET